MVGTVLFELGFAVMSGMLTSSSITGKFIMALLLWFVCLLLLLPLPCTSSCFSLLTKSCHMLVLASSCDMFIEPTLPLNFVIF
jgi:hypothetical protein